METKINEAAETGVLGAALVKAALNLKAKPAVKKAAAKKPSGAKKTAATASGLTFKVNVAAEPVDMETLQQEAKQRSEQLFGSATEYYENEKVIENLMGVPNVGLTSRGVELEKRLAEKKRFDANMAKQSQDVQQQFLTDLFIVRVNKMMPTSDKEVISVFAEIENMGRGHKPADVAEVAKVPKDQRLFFIDEQSVKHHLLHNLSQLLGREGQVSGADKLIFAATRSLIWRFSQYQEEQKKIAEAIEMKRIVEIKSQTGEDPRNFMRKIPGIYVLYLPGKMIGDKKVGMDGAARIELYRWEEEKKTKIGLRVLDGAGCLKPRWAKHPKFGWNFAFWWLEYFSDHQKDVVQFPSTIPAEIRGPMESFIRKLNAAVIQAKKFVWKDETPQAVKTAEKEPELMEV